MKSIKRTALLLFPFAIAACSSGGVVVKNDEAPPGSTNDATDGGPLPTVDAAPPCAEGRCSSLLWTGVTDETELGGVLTVNASSILWTNDYWDNAGQVYHDDYLAVPIDGTATKPVLTSSDWGEHGTEVFASVASASTVYFLTAGGGVESYPLNGGKSTFLFPLGDASTSMAAVVGLTLAGDALYGSAGWDGNLLVRIPTDGSNPTTLATFQASDPIGGGVVTDATNVYWEAIDRFSGQGAIGCNGGCIGSAYTMTVYSMPLSGGAPKTLAQVSMNDTQANTISMAVDRENVYFTDNQALVSVPIAGGAETTLAPSPAIVGDFAFDGESFFWTSAAGAGGSTGTIETVSSRGGAVSTFYSVDNANVVAVAVDATNVYALYSLWGIATNENPNTVGAIVKIPK
jgi:hypothetical protein